MAKFITPTNNLLLGEISRKAFGRTDIEQYKNAAETLQNVVVYPQGGAARRMGSIFVSSALSAQPVIRLIPFEISDSINFVVALYAGNFKVFNASTGAVVATIAYTYGTSYSATQLQQLQYSRFDRILILTHQDVAPAVIAYEPTATNQFIHSNWEIDEPTAAFSGTIGTAWKPTSRSLVYDLQVRKRAITTEFEMIPFLTQNGLTDVQLRVDDSVGAAPIAAGTSVTLNAENASGTPINYFVPAHGTSSSGTLFALRGGIVKVVAYVSPSQCTAVVLKAIDSESRTSEWHEAAWSGVRGWPKCSTFYNGRLIFASTPSEPDKCWFSELNDFVTFIQPGVIGNSVTTPTDATPFDLTLYTGRVDSIQWAISQKTLVLGTTSTEHIIAGTDVNQAITGENLPFTSPQTAFGSTYVQAQSSGDTPVFVDRTGTQLREFVFNEAEDQYKSQSLSLLAEHIFRRSRETSNSQLEPKISCIQLQRAKNPVIWAIDNNGGLVSCARDRQYGVLAFSHHILGGADDIYNPFVQSIATVRGPDLVNDDLWMVVERTINGTTVRYIERIGREFVRTDMQNDSTSINDKPVYMDCAAMTQSLGSPITTFTGFSHLIGQTVDVLADGEYVGQKVVDSSGQITLTNEAEEVIAGLNYRAIIKPVPVEAGNRFQTAQGSVKRIDQVHIDFFQTGHAKIGKDLDNLDEIIFRDASDPVEDPTPLYSGRKRIDVDGGYEFEKSFYIVSDKPLPMSVNNIIMEGVTYD